MFAGRIEQSLAIVPRYRIAVVRHFRNETFQIGRTDRFYELVVNKVQSKLVTGYISAPKGAEMAER